MNAIVFEHVPVAELPEKWARQACAVGQRYRDGAH
jgi:hypothetical protein